MYLPTVKYIVVFTVNALSPYHLYRPSYGCCSSYDILTSISMPDNHSGNFYRIITMCVCLSNMYVCVCYVCMCIRTYART